MISSISFISNPVLQTDPIGYADGINWYNYVGGGPVNRIDPSGMKKCLGSRIERPEQESCATFAGPGYSEIIVNADGDGRKLVDSGQGNSQVVIDPKTGLPQIVVTAPLHWVPISSLGSISVRSSSQSGISARRAICNLGDAAAVGGDVITDVGGVMAAGGAIGGAVLGAGAGGGGAIPGAIAGATPGLTAAGVGGTISAVGNLVKDVAGENYREGVARFALSFAAGKVFSRVAGGSGLGSYLGPATRKFMIDTYGAAAQTIAGRAFNPNSPVQCDNVG